MGWVADDQERRQPRHCDAADGRGWGGVAGGGCTVINHRETRGRVGRTVNRVWFTVQRSNA
ncbi:hypothetical protein TIFTF001_029156 [Ficus carica]|uniref:Uncharacterized protein n=1 Tax=Ficus carica TaxID=3494 RepID=A0AA88J228_FICCA|nr:hypothetical protein TIFTF001_029156 [Ficus carica]